jgi:peroxiredoxin
MSETKSTMLDLGSRAPDFQLPDPDGKIQAMADFRDAAGLLIAFICNHCPYVKHIQKAFAKLARDYQQRGMAIVAINSNDFRAYPDDSPARMKEVAVDIGYTFPYLVDASQDVAKAYRAACTPDFFLFDGEQRLVYRGQFDASRPGNDMPVTGADLAAALDAVLDGRPVSEDQKPSIGCNIKWKRGQEPDYFR